ncbi:hypothetical protein IW261DRAFT_1434273 [Armillaria novae-zelandiae]|uniref:Fork-head domain-containing protein n=1 Tax=Armillaria novae-zelandiae TaxID=153914 RepID=A0AA39PW37_9AGAR|nr:hypothetical protein IW261DRAFT_1434273 [Armillaria novae-zelandiae]
MYDYVGSYSQRMYAAQLEPSRIDRGLVHLSGGTDSNKNLPAPCFFPPPRDKSDASYVPKDGGGSQWYTPGDHGIGPNSLGWPLQPYHPVVDVPSSYYQAQTYDYPIQPHSPTYLISPVMEYSTYGHWADDGCAEFPYSSSTGSQQGGTDGVPVTCQPFSPTAFFQGQERPYHGHTSSQVRSSRSPARSMPYARFKHDSPQDVRLMGHSNSSNPRTPDAGSFLRKILNIPAHTPIHLSSLRDPRDRAGRPPYSIPQLAAVAIYSNQRDRASAAEIRKALTDRFEYFRHNESQLKETLKHALSHHSLFHRAPRTSKERGKGGFWYLDLSDPFGSRPRRRTVRHDGASAKHSRTVLDTSDGSLARPQRSLPAQADIETTLSTHSLVCATDSPSCSDSYGETSDSPTFLAADYMLQSYSG